jgi:hypothetical protein
MFKIVSVKVVSFMWCKLYKIPYNKRMNSNEIDIHKELKKYFGFGQFKVKNR